jgi:HK97 family phage major capsid protein
MKLKLQKEYQVGADMLPVDSIIEIEDEATANALIADGTATMYTEDTAMSEELKMVEQCAKSIKTNQKEVNTMSEEIKNKFGKAVKDAIETKAVTAYASTEATQPLGIVGFSTGLAGKVRKQTVKGNLNIVYSGTMADGNGYPVIDIVGEATAAATQAPLVQYDAIPAKWFATVAVPNEYLDDVVAMEAFVSEELTRKANLVIDNSIVNGPFTQNKGLKGIVTSADTVTVDVADVTLPTLPELHSMVDSILPELQGKAEWVISPAVWSNLKAELLDSNNLNAQLISDGANKTLLGYPVNVSVVCTAENPIVFGDFSQYIVGVAREMSIEVDRSAGFLTDVTPVKVSFRFSGGPACAKKVYDSVSYGAFVTCQAGS